MTKPSSTRYTLLLDDQANEMVARLQDTFGLRSRAAVFDLGTTLLNWVAEQKEEGFRIGRSDGKDFHELLIPVSSKKAAAKKEVTHEEPAKEIDASELATHGG